MEERGGEVETASLPFSCVPSMFDGFEAHDAPSNRTAVQRAIRTAA